jgi:isopenicillin N synthase-like dioxygenase
MKLLGIIGHFLGFEPKHLESMAERGNSTLRALHYPPLKGGEKGLRAGAHADINFITLLLPPSDAGLEILRPKGEWMPVIYPTGGLIVNAGDMLESYTKFRKKEGIRSTQHRVTNGPPGGPPSPKSRYSFPFFVHPRADVVVGERNGKPFTAAEFLEERLKENGVKA